MNIGIRYLNDVRLKSFVLASMLLAIAGVLIGALSQFRSSDHVPQIKLINMEMRKSIRNFSSVVKTGIYIKNFEEFSVEKDRFVVGALVWFKFNVDEVTSDLIEKFSFMNGNILEKSPPNIRMYDRTMFVKYDVRIAIKGLLSHKRFPFDDHRLSLMLTNNYVTPSEAYFTTSESDFGLSYEDIAAVNWQVRSKSAAWGYLDLELGNHYMQRPVVVYTMNFSKAGIRRIIIIFIPLLAALFLALFTFFLSIDNLIARFRLGLTALTAILSYRFIIERMMPNVGYFTTTDSVYTLLLLVSLAIFIFQVILTRQEKGGTTIAKKHRTFFETINSILYFFICIGVTGMFSYLVLY